MRVFLQTVHWRLLETHPNGSGTPAWEFRFSHIKSIVMQMTVNVTAPPHCFSSHVSHMGVSLLCSHPGHHLHPPSPRFHFQDIETSSCMGAWLPLSPCSGQNQINRHFAEFKMRPYVTGCVEVDHACLAAPGAQSPSARQQSRWNHTTLLTLK